MKIAIRKKRLLFINLVHYFIARSERKKIVKEIVAVNWKKISLAQVFATDAHSRFLPREQSDAMVQPSDVEMVHLVTASASASTFPVRASSRGTSHH